MMQKTSTRISKELDWLIRRKEILSIFKIEQDLGMSEGTLKKFVEGKRGLAGNWHGPVKEWVKNFKK